MDEDNRNRLEEFRQLRQEVRHLEEYLIVGMDIAKDRHYAFLGTATGKTLLGRLVFSNDHEGFRKLLDHTEAFRVETIWGQRLSGVRGYLGSALGAALKAAYLAGESPAPGIAYLPG